jgi:hypothetical protein
VPPHPIDLRAAVQAEREKCRLAAGSAFDDILVWLAGPAQALAVQDVEAGLVPRLMGLGCALMALWLALRLPQEVEPTMTHGRASYRCRGLVSAVLRSRFGEVESPRPVYELVHGVGPPTIVPHDRAVGLAAGRMTLGVHLSAAWLAARVAFDDVVDILAHFGGYVPSKRAILGIVDQLGPAAAKLLGDMPAPEDDGEILVLQNDDKGAPMLGKHEHGLRCRPHTKLGRGKNARQERRRRRRDKPRVRRSKGEKSKNARMGKVFVIYTMRRCKDGTLEGPINKRVIATFGGRRAAFELAKTEAVKRGYGKKPTYFLADGSRAIWRMQQEFFPLARTCVDWYHACEYLWKAGGTVFKEGSSELSGWVHARKRELLAGRLDAMFAAMTALRSRISADDDDGKARRKRLGTAIGFLRSQNDRLRYRELAQADMDIATGAAEGAVNHVIGRRLDGSMMRWSLGRAERVVALRCVLVNGLWDHFAQAVAAEHAKCRDPWVLRITPDKPQEPYDAVRKAA